MIKISGLTFDYPGHRALSNVSQVGWASFICPRGTNVEISVWCEYAIKRVGNAALLSTLRSNYQRKL